MQIISFGGLLPHINKTDIKITQDKYWKYIQLYQLYSKNGNKQRYITESINVLISYYQYLPLWFSNKYQKYNKIYNQLFYDRNTVKNSSNI